MSLARTILFSGQKAADLALFGEVLQFASGDHSGVEFRGVLTPVDPVEAQALFEDPRERATLEVYREDTPNIEPGDRIKQRGADGVTWQWNWDVVRDGFADNPAEGTKKFMLVKVVSGKDQ